MRRTVRVRGAPPPAVEALRRLEEAVAEAGSARAWADRAGVGEAYVSDVRRGLRSPGPAILSPLGLEKVVTYVAAEVRS